MLSAFRGGDLTTVTFPIPGDPLSMNGRLHYLAAADLVREWRGTARRAFERLPAADRPHGPSIVDVAIPFGSRRRRDPHNYYPTIKAIVDGIRDGGAWPDDDARHVATLEPELLIVPRPRDRLVFVRLYPMDDRP